ELVTEFALAGRGRIGRVSEGEEAMGSHLRGIAVPRSWRRVVPRPAFLAFWLFSIASLAVVPLVQSAALRQNTVTLEIYEPADAREPIVQAREWINGEFEKTHPNIKINVTTVDYDTFYTKLEAMAAAGDIPDVISTGQPSISDEYQKGIVVPMD